MITLILITITFYEKYKYNDNYTSMCNWLQSIGILIFIRAKPCC